MKKRILSIFIILILTFGLLPTLSFAATSGNCGAKLKWQLDTDSGTLTITGTGTMSSSIPWYSQREKIKSIIIEKGVTSIYREAFRDCNKLESVTLPEGLKTIGNSAFDGCLLLDSITVPQTVETVGDAAFFGCSLLKSVYISDMKKWCNILFDYHYSNPLSNGADLYLDGALITDLTIPAGVEKIKSYAFDGCTSITSISIPTSVTSIEQKAFNGCSGLASVKIPENVSSICHSAFNDCVSLKSISIPNSMSSIESSAFYGCISLKEVHITSIKSWCKIGFSDAAANPLNNGAALYLNGEIVTNVIIPSGITKIKNYTFERCSSIVSVTIPEGVTFIGDSAFYGCLLLKTVVIPDSVDTISDFAFSGCVSLCDVTISNGVTSIGDYAFESCKEIKRISIPETVDSIGNSAFEDSGIRVVYIPNSELDIGVGAFENTHISYVYFGGSEEDKQNLSIMRDNASLDSAMWVYDSTELPEHQYDDSCDKDCNICGATRTIPHVYGDYVSDNNASEKADGTKTRTCSVCGHEETVTAVGTKWQSSFTDIKTKDFYYKPTLWAVANGITTGTSKTTFSPNEACTRGQIVTFLWRAAGCPEPTTTTMPFTDVKNSAFYKKAVLWAVENGITSGTSKTTFSPNAPCTRGQIATFLWRAKGKPAPKSANMPFGDVAKKDFYYKAVQWAVENKITSGTSKTTFAPTDSCTRGQIVTFLYRAYK